jgi:CRP/FNR family cyclic AMP-dependent transcriptional regulator
MSGRDAGLIARVAAAAACSGVPAEDLARLLAAASRVALRDAESVFSRGDAADSVCFILAGSVRISTLAASGKRITVEIFQRDEIFGEIGAIDAGARTADATAMGATDLLRIPVAAFRELLARSAPLANNLLRLATTRLRRTYALLEDASLRPIELRLAKQILYLAKLGTVPSRTAGSAAGEAGVRLQARMHQDELADLLGVTTRSIINVLNKWRTEGLVVFDGRTAQLTILDLDRFRAQIQE